MARSFTATGSPLVSAATTSTRIRPVALMGPLVTWYSRYTGPGLLAVNVTVPLSAILETVALGGLETLARRSFPPEGS